MVFRNGFQEWFSGMVFRNGFQEWFSGIDLILLVRRIFSD
jgi:hypothetical protein